MSRSFRCKKCGEVVVDGRQTREDELRRVGTCTGCLDEARDMAAFRDEEPRLSESQKLVARWNDGEVPMKGGRI